MGFVIGIVAAFIGYEFFKHRSSGGIIRTGKTAARASETSAVTQMAADAKAKQAAIDAANKLAIDTANDPNTPQP